MGPQVQGTEVAPASKTSLYLILSHCLSWSHSPPPLSLYPLKKMIELGKLDIKYPQGLILNVHEQWEWRNGACHTLSLFPAGSLSRQAGQGVCMGGGGVESGAGERIHANQVIIWAWRGGKEIPTGSRCTS